MKGFVPTPDHLVDSMVERLFEGRPPRVDHRVLDPGCGTGAFIAGIIRWCRANNAQLPAITGVESDPTLLREAAARLDGVAQVSLIHRDFLDPWTASFDFIIGNPPYVPITDLSIDERERYRRRFQTAVGRFDLYLLFFEQALNLLRPDGRLVLVTPEKFVYVQTARALRSRLADVGVASIEFVDEATFAGLVTYPVVTTVERRAEQTRITLRDGASRMVRLRDGQSWLPLLHGAEHRAARARLRDAARRVSCGVATGADGVFVLRNGDVPAELAAFAYPVLAGRALVTGGELPEPTHQILVPYDRDGQLLAEHELGPLHRFLSHPDRRPRLVRRTCVAHKPWYAFHETPPLDDILQPKLLCKDIGSRPWFVVDRAGSVVPRHSLYYVVPNDPDRIDELCEYLNSEPAQEYLLANCQRAANGYLRMQSHVLKQMPIPEHLVAAGQLVLA